jgi:hypothetical protein
MQSAQRVEPANAGRGKCREAKRVMPMRACGTTRAPGV